MHRLKRYFKEKKYIILFLSVLLLIGLITGLYLGLHNIDYLKEEVIKYMASITTQSYNYIAIHFFLVVIGVITSFFAIGIPYLCTLIFYEGISIGFIIGLFSIMQGLKGFFFGIIFLFITKALYLICFVFIFSKCLQIARKMIGKYIYKTDPSIIITYLLKGTICVIGVILSYDLFLYFLGTPIIAIFEFLLK